MEKIKVGHTMSRTWTDPPVVLTVICAGAVPFTAIALVYLAIKVSIIAPVVVVAALWALYNYVYMATPEAKTTDFVIFKSKSLESKFGKRKIPMGILYEAFIRGDVEIKGELHETLLNDRHKFICYRPHAGLFVFLLKQLFPQSSSSFHSQSADQKEIHEHYDRGNDFFAAFLGKPMVYTSGVYHGLHQTLEEGQDNKMTLICDKLQLKEGERHLDIGCGWGTLVRHSAKNYKAKSTGVTLSGEGAKYCREQNEKQGLDNVTILHKDYRDIPDDSYDKISAIEMAEHVGLSNFQMFLGKISSMMKDDGLFMMQVAGLRKGSNWEDIQWGLFMSKYIFPGADASTPLHWYLEQLEQAGFEVRSVETIGKHYSHTLFQWYEHWEKNKAEMEPKYGKALSRLWSFFLSWSAIAAGQGTATCYQILCHKNTSVFDRNIFTSEAEPSVGVSAF